MTRTRRAALLALAGVLTAAAGNLASTPLDRSNLPWWRARFEAKQIELAHSHPKLLWLGDSITQDWERAGPQPWANFAPIWDHYYGDRDAINLGFKGDTTSHLLWRIEHGETDHMHPRGAIVLIGANNFGKLRWPAAPTLQGIQAIIDQLEARLPGCKIILVGVLPSIRNEWVDQNTKTLNAALSRRFGHDPVVTYVDVSDLFMKDGKIDRDAFLDPQLTPPDPPLHPTAQTQGRIAARLEPFVARILGDQPH